VLQNLRRLSGVHRSGQGSTADDRTCQRRAGRRCDILAWRAGATDEADRARIFTEVGLARHACTDPRLRLDSPAAK